MFAAATESWHGNDDPHDAPLTARRARDTVVDCFASAHGDRFGRVRAELGEDHGPTAVRRSVENLLRIAFLQVGGSFDEPTRSDLTQVVNLLAERSLDWGTPPEVVFDHHAAMLRLLGRLGDGD